jgi:large subunit ribosomal protein L15
VVSLCYFRIKGTGQRTRGNLKAWFTGGDTPLYMRTPKRGFRPPNPKPLAVVNLDRLFVHISQLRIDPKQKITIKTLIESNLINKRQVKFGIKILGGEIAFSLEGDKIFLSRFKRWLPVETLQNIHIEATDFSTNAADVLTKLNSKYTLLYRNRLSLRAHINPERFEHPKLESVPPPKYILKYRNQVVAGQYTFPKMGDVVSRR